MDLLKDSVPLEEVWPRGFYSAESVRCGNGTSIYLRPDGSEVEICLWYSSPEYLKDVGWLDLIDVGPVTKWVRVGQSDRERTIKSEY